jgi:hypothetical protein
MDRRNKRNVTPKSEKPVISQQAKLLGQIGDGQRVITGINDVLTSASFYDLTTAVTHIALPTADLVDSTSSLIDASIEDVINAFSSAKGYTSSVTPAIIRGHMKQVVKAVEALVVLKRSQDGKELTDSQGTDLDDVFFAVATDGRQYATSGGGFDPSVVAGAVPVTTLGVAAISNAAWANTYLAELGKLVIPQKVFDMLISLYSGVYNNPQAGLDSYFSFWPNSVVGLTALTTPEVVFSNAITTINSNLSSYPDLRTMLGLLGLDAAPCLNYDWNRDIKGQSVMMFDDPLIYTLIKNEFLSFSAFDEVDIPQAFQDAVELPFMQGTLAGFEDSFSIGSDMIPYLGLFRTVGSTGYPALLNSNFARLDSGTPRYVATLPAARLKFNVAVTALSATGETNIDTLQWHTYMSSRVLPIIEQVFVNTECINNDCDAFIYSVDANYAFTGYNKMVLSETDHDILNSMFVTELIFGSGYRENLKQIANSVTANIRIG